MKNRVKKRTGKSGVVWNRPGWYPIVHGFCPGKKVWRRYVKSIGLKNIAYPDTGIAHTDVFMVGGKMEIIVTVKNTHISPEDIASYIAHEATHVWSSVLKHIGEDGAPGEEMTAYAVQAITKDLLEAYAVTRGRKKKKAKK